MKLKWIGMALILTSVTVLLSFNVKKKRAGKPNVIVVYFDDMGYGDVDINGATGYRTPNMDQMASEGMFFSHFYSPQAVCTASRAGLLTGCYPNRIGFSGAIDHRAKIGLNEEEETIANLLKDQGYATAAYGKWHLGHLPQFLPTNHGFDEYFGIPYSNDMWPNHPTSKNYYPPLPLIENTKTIATNPDQNMFTTWFTEKTVGFIKKHQDEPFFVYLAHPMPHVPIHVSDKFRGKSGQGLYGDVIMELDWSIGEIRKTLKELDLDENTLMIVTSDNGPWINYGNHAGSTGGLREGKGTTFEGGQRVPCLMAWNGTIPAGKICNNLSSAIDVLPTIVEATGAKMPKHKIDGVSLGELLKGNFAANPRKEFYYYYRKNNLEAVRVGNYKLVFPHKGRSYVGFAPGKDGMPGGANEWTTVEEAMYDLRRDQGERYDIRLDAPEIEEELLKAAEKARYELGDALTGVEGHETRPIGRAE
ncbi:sulfatase [Marinilongibacter aquaticus]|uniref:sulfatase family protein n=1 Tax=Marinilongibacter aquaticus TaxID=2975157 RepID=UPI0021BD16CC|nr:sulfatase [Marinilongibacter aquaticus]UBM60209.1 sulfatase [Marinilongibacter aquaticus]